jgi:hypothetical protein
MESERRLFAVSNGIWREFDAAWTDSQGQSHHDDKLWVEASKFVMDLHDFVVGKFQDELKKRGQHADRR